MEDKDRIMQPVGAFYAAMAAGRNTTGADMYAPIALSQGYSMVARLLFMTSVTVFSLVQNSCFITAFCTERALSIIGNAFLACWGLSDLLITGVVFPMSTVVILTDEWDTPEMCRIIYFVTQWSTYSYSISFLMMGLEILFRTCRVQGFYAWFLRLPIIYIGVCIFVVSCLLAGAGVFLNLDYDYCTRQHFGNQNYRIYTLIAGHLVPGIVGLAMHIVSMCVIQKRFRDDPDYTISEQYVTDSVITNINIFAYILHVSLWLPYLVNVIFFPTKQDANFYTSAWLGLARPSFASCVYCLINNHFKHAFSRLFNYVCCKREVTYVRPREETHEIRLFKSRKHLMQPRRKRDEAGPSQETRDL